MGTIEKYLAETQDSIPIIGFIINFLFTFLCSWILSKVYKSYGTSISDRSLFSKNFIFISLTTMLIITIIKSSLALSLGLVGALSIIRFRTAIKEPEELSYAFLAIAVGLGFGANQIIITLLGLAVILSLIILNSKIQNKNYINLLNLVISSRSKLDIKRIIEIVSKNATTVNLKRLTETEENNESSLTISILNFDQLVAIREELLNYNPNIQISFLDESGLINY